LVNRLQLILVEEQGEASDTPDPVVIFKDAHIAYLQLWDGTLHFYAPNGTLLATLKESYWSGASAGIVLVNTRNSNLQLVLLVTALGNQQLQVQLYASTDGSLLSDAVISPGR
jgi:hypothetical protein